MNALKKLYRKIKMEINYWLLKRKNKSDGEDPYIYK